MRLMFETAIRGAKRLLVAVATIDFAFSTQNQCRFELKV